MGSQKRETTYPDEQETAFWVALNLAQRSTYRAMEVELKSNGLPPLRWYDVLWGLERVGECGLRAFEIERRLLFEQSNLSRLLRNMIDEGLVDEAVYEGDRRGKILRITPQGLQVRKKMWNVYGPLLKAHMTKVSQTGDIQSLTEKLNLLCPEGVFEK